jgi:hypothetical protein
MKPIAPPGWNCKQFNGRYEMSWHSKTWYEIGVYWPNDGAYGIPDIANTEEQARAKKEFAERNGYNVPGKSEVHIRKVTVERII